MSSEYVVRTLTRCVDQREPISASRPRFVDIVAELRHIVRQAEQVGCVGDF